MATVLEVPKLTHCRHNNDIWQKLSDKQCFKRQARDGVPAIEYCVMRNINTKEEVNFQFDVEVVVVHPDNLITFSQLPQWKKFLTRGLNCVKVPGDTDHNSVTEKCAPIKVEDDRFVELL